MCAGDNIVAFVQNLQGFMLASEKCFNCFTKKSSVDF